MNNDNNADIIKLNNLYDSCCDLDTDVSLAEMVNYVKVVNNSSNSIAKDETLNLETIKSYCNEFLSLFSNDNSLKADKEILNRIAPLRLFIETIENILANVVEQRKHDDFDSLLKILS
jgi:hypothetical protein